MNRISFLNVCCISYSSKKKLLSSLLTLGKIFEFSLPNKSTFHNEERKFYYLNISTKLYKSVLSTITLFSIRLNESFFVSYILIFKEMLRSVLGSSLLTNLNVRLFL